MEKAKEGKVQSQQKVDGDGLTKKERRALKVQEKLKDVVKIDGKATNGVASSTSPTQQKVDKSQKKKDHTANGEQGKAESTKQTDNKQLENGATNSSNVTDASLNNKLCEKELRKLEWEKKLAEQKKQSKEGSSTEGLTKAELKIKRREQQEAQRLAKATVKAEPKPDIKTEKEEKPPAEPANKKIIKKSQVKKSVKAGKFQIVDHLFTDKLRGIPYDIAVVNSQTVHPAFAQLGLLYSKRKVLGSNARCIALLASLKILIEELKTPPKQEYCRYLEVVLNSSMKYLQYCRPSAVSMTNALRDFKYELHKCVTIEDEEEKKIHLLKYVDKYIDDQFNKAGEAISSGVRTKIHDGDVILTYGSSSLVRRCLKDAHHRGKKFRVIVADERPFFEGQEMCRFLKDTGIETSYIRINAVRFVIDQVTSVLVGAHAILVNGSVMSRIGTAQVTQLAKDRKKPVLICCESYKFTEAVQTDAFVYNELGDADGLICKEKAISSRKSSKLSSLNILYDIAPPICIDTVITERGSIPCSSVAGLLRVISNDFI